VCRIDKRIEATWVAARRMDAEGFIEGIGCMPMDGSDRWIIAGERIDG